MVIIMATALSIQKARRALVPMRKATIDAFLLGTFIIIILTYTGILFTFPLLVVFVYALAYLLAVVIRLRKAAFDAGLSLDREHTLDEANATLSSERNLIGLLLFWGNHPSM